jgi:hypothetical protein
MNHPSLTILWNVLRKKLAIILLLSFIAYGAFATLGDGNGKDNPRRSLLSDKSKQTRASFSLKSGYTYRGNKIFSPQSQRYVNLNTTITYQRGHTTYTVPMKKMVLDNKVTFNPNAATRH